MGGRWLRNSFIYLLILVAIVAIVFTLFGQGGSSTIDQPLTEFIAQAREGNVESVEVNGEELKYKLIDTPDQTFKSKMERGDTVRQVLRDEEIPTDKFPAIKITSPSFWRRCWMCTFR